MNKDVAYWLLMYAQQIEDQNGPHHLSVGMREGADEIKRLRAALHRIGLPLAQITYCRDGHEEAVLIARAALGGGNG